MAVLTVVDFSSLLKAQNVLVTSSLITLRDAGHQTLEKTAIGFLTSPAFAKSRYFINMA